MSPDEIRNLLTKAHQAFPFPQSEIDRNKGRRWIVNYVPKGGIGAEIGVFRGHFSEILIETLSPSKIYLVDPWRLQGRFFEHVGIYTNGGKLPTQLAREEAMLRALQFPTTRAVAVEGYFPDCLSHIQERLDWVYLDATHEHDKTLSELRVADGILAPDGVIFGDDWTHDRGHPHHGVFTAVNAFLKEKEYEVVAAGPYMQWCIRQKDPAKQAPKPR